MDYGELEIGLRRNIGADEGAHSYLLEMRFVAPNGETEQRMAEGDATVTIPDELFNPPADAKTYGAKLRDALLPPDVRRAFHEARSQSGSAMRVRLYIEPRAAELQRIRWEAMAD